MSEIPHVQALDYPAFTSLMMIYLLFRLGGYQRFTGAEMNAIGKEFTGIRLAEARDGSSISITLITRERDNEYKQASEAQASSEGDAQDGGSNEDRV